MMELDETTIDLDEIVELADLPDGAGLVGLDWNKEGDLRVTYEIEAEPADTED